MNQLIIGPLQESRVNGHDRFKAIAGHASCEGEGMLFRDSDIEIAFRVLFSKFYQSGAFPHGRGDPHQAFIFSGHIA